MFFTVIFLNAKSMETGLFHTRPIRTRAARFGISRFPSGSNNGSVYIPGVTLALLHIQRYSECSFLRTTVVVQHCIDEFPVQLGRGLCLSSS